MDLKEILKEAGVEDKAIKQILTTMKAEKIYTTSEENADIRIKKFKEKQESLEEELKENVEKFDSLKALETEKERLSSEIETMKKDATEKEFNSALENALKEAKSKNNKLIVALLDRDKLTLKDGKLEGIEDQLKGIKEENDFLFGKDVGGIPDFKSGGNSSSGKSEDENVGTKFGKQRAEQVNNKGILDFIK